MSQESTPNLSPDAAPLHLQLAHLEKDPSDVDRREFSPAENLALDFGRWVMASAGARVPEGDLEGEYREITEDYHYTGEPNLILPAGLRFSVMRAYNGKSTDFIHFTVSMFGAGGASEISLSLVTDHLPSLTGEEDGGEEILSNFSLNYAPQGDGVVAVGVGSHETPDEESLALLSNTVGRLKGMLETDYEILP